MKVLMTTDTLGGVWTYCIELCTALAPHGIRVALATMGRPLSPEQRRQVGTLPNVDLFESHYRLCWMQDAWQDVEAAGDWLLKIENEFQPDVVHLNDLAHGALPWQAPIMLAGHSCVFSWWEAVCDRLPPKDEWQKYHEVVSRSVQEADVVVAPSQDMLSALLRHYGPAKASAVIYNGRDFPAMPKEVPQPGDPASPKEPLIFAAGRIWDPAKNVAVLSQVAPNLQWPVYAAGEHQDPNGGSQHPEGIHCLGFLDSSAVASWLQKTSIFVAPAHYEPFGLSILEAARTGCALVLADIPSLREVWGEAAAYVDPNNPDQIFEALDHLTRNPESRLQLAERAWQRAKRYSAPRMAAETIKTYQHLQHGHSGHVPRHSASGVH